MMKVKEIMSGELCVCTPHTNLAEAVAMMLKADCGILPVVTDGQSVGVVTDRDLYIALATRNRLASELTVGEVARQPVYTCSPDDDVLAALETMKTHRIRRLVVGGFGGTVIGVVSMNDIVLAAGTKKPLNDTKIANVLRAICAHHHAPTIVAA